MAHPGAGQQPLTGPTGPARPGEYPTYPAEQSLGFERLVFLSDGVFAIALTLLALLFVVAVPLGHFYYRTLLWLSGARA